MQPIWKLLTWEQAASILIQPQAIDLAFAEALAPACERRTSESWTQAATNTMLNVGQWLNDQLDTVSQSWSWALLPPMPAMRSSSTITDSPLPAEQFEQVMSSLNRQGTSIPPHARAAYRDLNWGDAAVRLYMVTWDSSTPSTPNEWSLLILLGAQPNRELPGSVTLNVQDHDHVLDEQTLSNAQSDAYVFSQILGDWDEEFWVTIGINNRVGITMPPFTFNQHAL